MHSGEPEAHDICAPNDSMAGERTDVWRMLELADGENCRFSIAPSVDGLIERAGNCDSAFSIVNRQSAIGNENLVSGAANYHSAIMSLFELGTSYPKTGHLSCGFRPLSSLTP
jgi:hypothetical protein